jgi:tripeptide aminopeptidase
MQKTIDGPGARGRMLADFADIVGVDSPSFHEREMAELLRRKLSALGFEVEEDGAGAAAGGECGNLIATLRGDARLPAVAMLAHMDTVEPCRGKKCVADAADRDILRSDGTTVLGGDDAAGIVAALETARRLGERGIGHGDLQIILTIAEERGLVGAKRLDYSKVRAKYCFVFDSGTAPGSVVARAPTHVNLTFTLRGRSAHAGIEPEKGVSAVQAFAEAVAGMKLGRIDAETTANIGVVRGGEAVNAVCAELVAECEARSHDRAALRAQIAHMRQCFERACAKFGASVSCVEEEAYAGFSLDGGSPIVRLLAEAARRLGGSLELLATGGGSDANVLNAMGIMAANLPVGMHAIHSVKEYADLRETESTVELVLQAFALLGGQ